MALPDLKQLDKFLQLCIKRGIKLVKVDGLEFHIDESQFSKRDKTPAKLDDQAELIAEDPIWDKLTDEEKLFWSSKSE